MTEHNYREVSCQKAVSGPDFVRGVQDFNFSLGAPSVWIPRKSYFKIGLKITGKNGELLKTADCSAFADNVCGGLYNNAFFRIGGQDVSTINNYVAQASILKTRFKSNAWLKSIGQGQSYIESDLGKRIGRLASDTPFNLTPRPVIVPLTFGVNPADEVTVALVADTGIITGVNTGFEVLLRECYDGVNIPEGGVRVYNAHIVINRQKFEVRKIIDSNTITVDRSTAINIGPTEDAYFIIQRPFDADSKSITDVLWQPPLGIFDLEDQKSSGAGEVLGAGDYRISLNPNSNYKYACIETTKFGALGSNLVANGALPPGPAGFFDIEVTDVKFYMAYQKMAVQENGIRQLSLQEMLILSKPIVGISNTYEFSVPSSTNILAVFVQSPAVNSNCAYPPSKFTLCNNTQNNLSGFQITYGNTTKPSTKWQSAFQNPLDPNQNEGVNQLVQRYHDNLSEAGLLLNVGGAETIQDYLNRGWYILYTFIRDQSDKSTQVQVSLDFRDAVEINSSVYVCAIYDRQVEITTNNGTTVSVRSQN